MESLEAPAIDLWIQSTRPRVRELFLSRFQKGGGIPAADPGPNPDYAADWLRDSGLAWLILLAGARRGELPIPDDQLIPAIRQRIKFQRHRVESSDRHGSNPSEPRSDLSGEVFTFQGSDGKEYLLPWGRPQSDGAAIAALELNAMAEYLLSRGQEALVRAELFDNGTYPVPYGLLKRFTQHIANEGISHELEYPDLYGTIHKGTLAVESWEEIHGNHFYTALLQMDALTRAIRTVRKLAQLDKRTNTLETRKRAADLDATAKFYLTQAKKLRAALDQHWIEDPDGAKLVALVREGAAAYDRAAGIEEAKGNAEAARGLRVSAASTREKAVRIEARIRSDPAREWPEDQRGFIIATLGARQELTWHFEKMRHRDSLVILGIVHTHRAGPSGKWSPTSPRVLATLHALELDARDTFPRASWVDGVAPVMRYSEDLWQGVKPEKLAAGQQGKTGTYAWTLLTEAFSTIHSFARNEYMARGRIMIDKDNLPFFRDLARYGLDVSRLRPGVTLNRSGESADLFRQAISGLERKALAYLTIIKKTMDLSSTRGALSAEGFEPVTGAPRGPTNLTWNFVEWLRAVWAREDIPGR